MPKNYANITKSNYVQILSMKTRTSVLRIRSVDHCQRVQDQEALERVTNSLRQPSLFLANAHQVLQLVSSSPHEALASVVGNPAHHLLLV